MCRRGTNAYDHHLDFQYKNFEDVFSIVKKMAFFGEFQHTSLWEIFFSQCSTPLVGMRLCRHVPNSPRNKNKMMHHPCLLEKVIVLASKTLLSPISTWKRKNSSTLNLMILQMVRNECAKFGGHVDRQVNYKILQLKVPNIVQTLHNPPCF
jgi:hypothetical protein